MGAYFVLGTLPSAQFSREIDIASIYTQEERSD